MSNQPLPIGEFPQGLSQPALRAIQSHDIKNLQDLSQRTKKEVANFHGMGPKGVKLLEDALHEKGLAFHSVNPSTIG